MSELRNIHNTNSVNFVKLDYKDICYCLDWAKDLELSQDEEVTIERLKIIKKFMEKKYQNKVA